ncbi:MAG: hypothetical protein JWO69_2030 [Thermoleophilia bacterium]|nr:hypothetical protein [Thermoleophilia bacterium]
MRGRSQSCNEWCGPGSHHMPPCPNSAAVRTAAPGRSRSPRRVRRQRTKGWTKPEGAVYVGRGSEWGNPWKIGDPSPWGDQAPMDARQAVDTFAYGVCTPHGRRRVAAALAGRDLMCWCPLDRPCHADVLLALANPADHECDGDATWCWSCEYRERAKVSADATEAHS